MFGKDRLVKDTGDVFTSVQPTRGLNLLLAPSEDMGPLKRMEAHTLKSGQQQASTRRKFTLPYYCDGDTSDDEREKADGSSTPEPLHVRSANLTVRQDTLAERMHPPASSSDDEADRGVPRRRRTTGGGHMVVRLLIDAQDKQKQKEDIFDLTLSDDDHAMSDEDNQRPKRKAKVVKPATDDVQQTAAVSVDEGPAVTLAKHETAELPQLVAVAPPSAPMSAFHAVRAKDKNDDLDVKGVVGVPKLLSMADKPRRRARRFAPYIAPPKLPSVAAAPSAGAAVQRERKLVLGNDEIKALADTYAYLEGESASIITNHQALSVDSVFQNERELLLEEGACTARHAAMLRFILVKGRAATTAELDTAEADYLRDMTSTETRGR